MVSMIRTNTFLKYARIHLQDCEAFLQDELAERAVAVCSDVAEDLLKAILAALPQVSQDILAMDEKGITTVLLDLADTPEEARRIARDLCELRSMGSSARNAGAAREEAEAALEKAGEAFRQVHALFVT